MGASAMTMALGGIGNTLAAAAPGREPKISKNDKVRIAYIGIGNRGEQNIDEFARTGMVDVTV
ncbi:MAG: hypothetical protein K2G29_11745, partial [Muribaculaceae bacterium]|nr:hypothetical protein [Muribaculaceae bacterium]